VMSSFEGFPLKLHARLLCLVCATCLAYFTLLGFITLIIYAKNASNEGPHYAVLSNFPSLNLCGANILLSTLFSNTLSLCSSHDVRDSCFLQCFCFHLLVKRMIKKTYSSRLHDDVIPKRLKLNLRRWLVCN
jgi:hypothetical protein